MSRNRPGVLEHPVGSLGERLARAEPARVDGDAWGPDAFDAQRHVLAVLEIDAQIDVANAVETGQAPLPGDEREPNPDTDGPGAADGDAADASDGPTPIPLTETSLGSVAAPSGSAAASPTIYPDEELVQFRPVRTLRIAATVALAIGVVAVLVTAYAAWRSPTARTIGVATATLVVAVVVARIHASVGVARVSIAPGGRLVVDRGGRRTVFDLASGSAPVDEIGEPTERGWRVLVFRTSRPPFVIDRRLVHPTEFSPILRRYVPRVIQ